MTFRYYNYTLSVNGEAEQHGDVHEKDYLTDVIGRKAENFLDILSKDDQSNPFLMVLSFTAPHEHSWPSPHYDNDFSNRLAPRTPAFNNVDGINEHKHWLLRNSPLPLGEDLIPLIDDQFRKRWRTLLSVDDVVDKIMMRLNDLGILEDTFVIFTSDVGYHLGTFAMPVGRLLPYETGNNRLAHIEIRDFSLNLEFLLFYLWLI